MSYVVGIGYRDEEFDMFGVERRGRGRMVEERIGLLQRLWSGEQIDLDGRPVRVTPLPFTPGGPMLAYGGGTEVAARRAGRLGLMFMAESHDSTLEEACSRRGWGRRAGCVLRRAGVPNTVFVADDPERAWAEIGEYLLLDAVSYSAWNAHREGTVSISRAPTVAALAAEKGAYQIITPAEAWTRGRGQPARLQPLVGGIPRDVAWPYLEAAAAVSATLAGDPLRSAAACGLGHGDTGSNQRKPDLLPDGTLSLGQNPRVCSPDVRGPEGCGGSPSKPAGVASMGMLLCSSGT